MRKLTYLLVFAFLFISPVKAQNCKVLPTCEELGYTKTVSQCAGIEYLTCPFDETKVYCPSLDPCANITGVSCTYCKTWDSNCNVCLACCSTSTYPYTASNCNGTLGGSTCTDKDGTIHYSTCTVDPCAGYYECGGPWQYCTGYTCSADSTKCSVYCEDDYFKYSCSSSSYCDGVYRSGYCSVPCDEPVSDPCDNYTGQSCTFGCKETYSDCSSKCKTCYSDNCHNRTNQTCGIYDCASHYQDCSTKCETCCAVGDGWTSCPEGANCSSSVCGYIVTSCNTGYRKVFNDVIGLDTCYCDFTDYPKVSCKTYEICESTTCQNDTRYKLTGCVSGMKLATVGSARACICDYPSGYWPKGYVTCSSPNICDVWTCVNGDKYYKVVGCGDGYEPEPTGLGCFTDYG